jgi:hypothetical protein
VDQTNSLVVSDHLRRNARSMRRLANFHDLLCSPASRPIPESM